MKMSVMKFLSLTLLVSAVVNAIDVDVENLSLVHKRYPGITRATATAAFVVNDVPQRQAEAKVCYDPTPGASGITGVVLFYPDNWFAIEPDVVVTVKAPTIFNATDGSGVVWNWHKDIAHTNTTQTNIRVFALEVDDVGFSNIREAQLSDGVEVEMIAIGDVPPQCPLVP